ncbi:Dehydrogenase, E1 component [Penicillium digitatum]|uniref:Dehydrogenase, E1 component n=1 Tax=Penicillium digitatum TaxID=36651 RepID=A0A7T6XE79_PENDI|nr:Dehydrogenase, E1 component [Penicillium digitatum]
MIDLERAIQHGLPDIEGLPPSVKVYHYNGMDDFYRIIALEIDRLHACSGAPKTKEQTSASCEGRKENSNPLPLIDGTLRTFTGGILLGDCCRPNFPGDSRNSHNKDESEDLIFIIHPTTFQKDFMESDPPMLGPAHEHATQAFHSMLMQAIEPTGLHQKIQHWGKTTMLALDGTRKEADGGWSLLRHSRGVPKRPTVVLEVANSETYAKLQRDAQYWLDPARQEANVAIGVNLNTQKPEIIIDQWHWSSGLSQPILQTHLTLRETSNAQENRERDIVIATQELVDFATQVWEVQFDQDQ